MMTTDQIRAQSKIDDDEKANLERLVDYFGEAMKESFPKKTDRLVTTNDDVVADDYDDEEDELQQALVLLSAAHETLRGVSWIDGKKDFLSPTALVDLESLSAKMKEFLNQYEVEEHSDMFRAIVDGY